MLLTYLFEPIVSVNIYTCRSIPSCNMLFVGALTSFSVLKRWTMMLQGNINALHSNKIQRSSWYITNTSKQLSELILQLIKLFFHFRFASFPFKENRYSVYNNWWIIYSNSSLWKSYEEVFLSKFLTFMEKILLKIARKEC